MSCGWGLQRPNKHQDPKFWFYGLGRRGFQKPWFVGSLCLCLMIPHYILLYHNISCEYYEDPHVSLVFGGPGAVGSSVAGPFSSAVRLQRSALPRRKGVM